MSEFGIGPAPEKPVSRLWRNQNRYCGETIEIEKLLEDCLSAATKAGWCAHHMLPEALGGLPAFTRSASAGPNGTPSPTLYISAGIHGDEPASPLAALALLQQDAWPSGLGLILCPCLNPEAFQTNTREHPSGLDLNRQYRALKAAETRAHTQWLATLPRFDLALCLHEDWESDGFYLYELNPDHRPSIADKIIAAAETVCPVDRSETIEGWPAHNGVIRPGVHPDVRPDWPEAFYLVTHKTRISYTLEAPSDYPLHVRTAALVEGTKAAASALCGM